MTEFDLVEMVKKYWNQIEDWIFDAYGLISSVKFGSDKLVFASLTLDI